METNILKIKQPREITFLIPKNKLSWIYIYDLVIPIDKKIIVSIFKAI